MIETRHKLFTPFIKLASAATFLMLAGCSHLPYQDIDTTAQRSSQETVPKLPITDPILTETAKRMLSKARFKNPPNGFRL